MKAFLRWILFTSYLFLLSAAPFTLLWGKFGLIVGSLTTVSLIAAMRLEAVERLKSKLKAKPLSIVEAPHIHAITNELARRLHMSRPRIGWIDTPSINLATFGFGRRSYWLVLTKGLLDRCSREELTAVIGRQLCYLRSGQVACDSWLAQFLSAFDGFAEKEPRSARRDWSRFPMAVRQTLFYPFALCPVFCLCSHRKPWKTDLESLKLTHNTLAFSEVLKRIEAMAQRLEFRRDFSVRHLFLVTPTAFDPVARILFRNQTVAKRIDASRKLTQVVSPI